MQLAKPLNIIYPITLILIVIIGTFHLPYPFFGDQAFFLLGAKELHEGMVLYQDFWDIKQPGIFYFFLIAGKFFGFNELGVHLFELLTWLFFSVLLIWFLKKYIFKDALWKACFSTLMIVGSYYLCAGTGKLTQVEALVIQPMMLVVIFNHLYIHDHQRRFVWLVLSGIAGGVVLLYKFIFLPIIGLFYLFTLIRVVKVKSNLRQCLAGFSLVIGGMLLAWLPFIVYCYKNEIGTLVLNTFFVAPVKVIAFAGHKSLGHLWVSVSGFFPRILFILILFFYGAYHFRKNSLVQDMVIWFLASLFVILIQKTSWWGYHFQLLYAPIAIISAFVIFKIIEGKAFARVSKSLKLKPTVAIAFFLILVNSPQIFIGLYKMRMISNHDFLLTGSGRRSFILNDKFNLKANQVARKMGDHQQNEIFVAGDPLIYYYSGRNQATVQNGWGLQFFIPEQWLILQDELTRSKPGYIFFDSYYMPILKTKGINVLSWVSNNYTLVSSDQQGDLYRAKN